MNTGAKHDLSHISFAGTGPARPQRSGAHAAHAASAAATPVSEEPLDEFISWVLGRAGLEAAAYRVQPLQRRLPACLRVLKVNSTHAARELLERRPPLIATVVNSLLIGVTEFFRGPDVFASLRGQVLPALADRPGRLRIWRRRVFHRRRTLQHGHPFGRRGPAQAKLPVGHRLPWRRDPAGQGGSL